MILGQIRVKDFLVRTQGAVRGRLLTDAKNRYYWADYRWEEDDQEPDYIWVSRTDRSSDRVKIRSTINLDESLVVFFGLYSGDGAKGGEQADERGRVIPLISFSQKESNLILFAYKQIKHLFPGQIRFTFSLGEDSAYFMSKQGLERLKRWYGGELPQEQPLSQVRPILNNADKDYLQEKRYVQGTAEQHLAFYYTHKNAMEAIFTEIKRQQIEKTGIQLGEFDRIKTSMRRPFKKGAREQGGSSRADELTVGDINGIAELFLKMMHEIESSIYTDSQESSQGLIKWIDVPSKVGQVIDIKDFFLKNSYGELGGSRPEFGDKGNKYRRSSSRNLKLVAEQPSIFQPLESVPKDSENLIKGWWHRSRQTELNPRLRIDPLWCYTSGLYLAEGTTDKAVMFSMFRRTSNILELESDVGPDSDPEIASSLSEITNPKKKKLGLGFTSSENMSIELILRALQKLFPKEACLQAWKVKVGSQYFPELVVIGLKNAVPMLRGGDKGDGKLRTMEISLTIKEWALSVVPAMKPFEKQFSHVEPTGSGVPRIDFWASPKLCKWYFSLIIYATFGEEILKPDEDFVYE